MRRAAACTMTLAAILIAAPAVHARQFVDIALERVVRVDPHFGTEQDDVGTGFIVGVAGDDVFVATAAHVIVRDRIVSSEIDVLSPNGGRLIKATFINATEDTSMDLALLRVTDAGLALRHRGGARICDREPSQDEKVTTIGYPLGEPARVNTVDSVIAVILNRDTRKFAISGRGVAQGSSGGPVFGAEGCLIGIMTDVAHAGSPVTKINELRVLASSGQVNLSLVGGRTGPELSQRREIFSAVTSALDGYAFALEGVAALFRRQRLDPIELKQTIEAYNTAYDRLYQGRSGMRGLLGEQFGGQRGAEFQNLVEHIDATAHKTLVYSRLNDIVISLRERGKLSGSERRQLAEALTALDGAVADIRPRIRAYLDVLRPLVERVI